MSEFMIRQNMSQEKERTVRLVIGEKYIESCLADIIMRQMIFKDS